MLDQKITVLHLYNIIRINSTLVITFMDIAKLASLAIFVAATDYIAIVFS